MTGKNDWRGPAKSRQDRPYHSESGSVAKATPVPKGYVRLYRTLAVSDLMRDPRGLQVFVHLLVNARWQPESTTCKGVEVRCGQVLTSVRQVQAAVAGGASCVLAALTRLESAGRIERADFGRAGTLVTITGWRKYQDSNRSESEAQTTPDRSESGTQTTPDRSESGAQTTPDRSESGAQRENKKKNSKSKNFQEREGPGTGPRTLVGKSPDPADLELAGWMAEKVRLLYPPDSPPRAPNLARWADTIRLIRTRDGRGHAAIRELFAWANTDDFWAKNILSPDKLRQQWDKLTLQRSRSTINRKDRTNEKPTRFVRPDASLTFRDTGF